MRRSGASAFYRGRTIMCLWIAAACGLFAAGCAPRPYAGDTTLHVRHLNPGSAAMIDLGAMRLNSDAYQAAVATEYGLLGVDIHEDAAATEPWGEIRVVHVDARVMHVLIYGTPDDDEPDRVVARLGYKGNAHEEARFLRALSAKAARPTPRTYRGHFELPPYPRATE